jgi:hypothetical protein
VSSDAPVPPDFVNGLLPARHDGDPYDLTVAQVEHSFVFTPERGRSWAGFLAVKVMLEEFLNLLGHEWWLKGRFVTGAAEPETVDAVLVINDHLWTPAQDTLVTLLRDPRLFRDALRCTVLVVRMNDEQTFDQERRRCGRNAVHDGAEFCDAGWVRIR